MNEDLNLYSVPQWIFGTREKGRMKSDPEHFHSRLYLQWYRDFLWCFEISQSTREVLRFPAHEDDCEDSCLASLM